MGAIIYNRRRKEKTINNYIPSARFLVRGWRENGIDEAQEWWMMDDVIDPRCEVDHVMRNDKAGPWIVWAGYGYSIRTKSFECTKWKIQIQIIEEDVVDSNFAQLLTSHYHSTLETFKETRVPLAAGIKQANKENNFGVTGDNHEQRTNQNRWRAVAHLLPPKHPQTSWGWRNFILGKWQLVAVPKHIENGSEEHMLVTKQGEVSAYLPIEVRSRICSLPIIHSSTSNQNSNFTRKC